MNRASIKNRIRRLVLETLRSRAVINESMSVHVQGAHDKYKRTDLLNELANHLLDTVVSPLLHKMPQDQQDYFKRNSVGFYNLIVPDGSYYDGNQEEGKTGIINFYTDGITSQPLREILKGIFDELRRMKIKWGKISKGQSGAYKSQVIRIPIVSNPSEYSGPPEFSMSNVNAYHIFHNVLGFEPADEYNSSFVMSVKELEDSIVAAMKDAGWIKKNIRPDSDSRNPSVGAEHDGMDIEKNPHDDILGQIAKSIGGEDSGEFGEFEPTSNDSDETGGAHIISYGLDEESIKTRLGYLLKICDWAKKNGATKISVA